MTVLPVATLGVINFLFALCWLVYVTFLGELLERVGLGKSLLVWFVILDQLVMAVADVTAGFASDRLQRLFGRLGPLVLGFNIVSCAAFLLMPHVTGLPPVVFVVLTMVWIVTGSVVRAPLYVLLGRYPDLVRREWLAAVALIGLALAGAISPYLGLTLRQLDPVLPFALTGVMLVVSVFGVPGLEKRLAVASAVQVRVPPPSGKPGAALVLGALLFGLGFQMHFFLNSPPQYLAFITPAELPYFLPLFWIGAKLFAVAGAFAQQRMDSLRLLAIAGVLGAVGAGLCCTSPTLDLLIAGQILAGGAWGLIFMAGIGGAFALGSTGREGRMLGLWFGMLAVAALMRALLTLAHLSPGHALQPLVAVAPAVFWVAAALIVLVWLGKRGGRRAAA
jgi:hypothetical protein